MINVEPDVRLKKVRDLVAVSYYAYNKPPFETDAIAYVPENKLLDAHNDRYTYWDRNDELIPRSGFELVYPEDRDSYVESVYAVRLTNMYRLVFEHDGIAGGWATAYPGSGITSTSEPTHIDEEGNLYNQGSF